MTALLAALTLMLNPHGGTATLHPNGTLRACLKYRDHGAWVRTCRTAHVRRGYSARVYEDGSGHVSRNGRELFVFCILGKGCEDGGTPPITLH